MSEPRKIFISYAHEDEAWLNRILEIVARNTDPKRVKVWTDHEIREGDEWRKEILDALERSEAALLIVSKNFLKSHFIEHVELPQLRKLYKDNEFRLTWIRVDDVDYGMAVYTDFQAIIGPEPPLQHYPELEQERILENVVEKLVCLIQGERQPEKSVEKTTSRRGLITLAAVVLVLLAMWISTLTTTWRPDAKHVQTLLNQSRWIGYDPKDYVPNEMGNVADYEIESELMALRSAGFTGIVTYGARPDLARIAPIANRLGLQVIMGVWNPKDAAEIRSAYEHREYVQAYCVGHNCLTDDSGQTLCTEDELERIISQLRTLTRKPVTTSQLAKCYQPTSLQLNRMGDFFFPDIHHNFDYESVQNDIEITTQTVQRVAQIAEQFRRPVMLKSFCYPTRTSFESPPDYEKQQTYLTSVLSNLRDEQTGLAKPVAYTLGTAFDAPWKTGGTFRDWDPFTGLFNSARQPHPTVRGWMNAKGESH